DHPPQVVLTKPGQDVELPANGTLELAGSASDDIGVKSVTLRLAVKDGPALKPVPYREGKSFRFDDGGYPKVLDYEEVVELAKVRGEGGQPVELRPGMVLEYWLEAEDNCDYPGPNRGKSDTFHVKITEAKNDAQQKKGQEQASQKKQQHDKEQDRKHEQ